jgi:hypothetical protein
LAIAVAAVGLVAPAVAVAAPRSTPAVAAATPRRVAGLIPDIPNRHVTPRYAVRAANLSYGGGPVLHFNRTHVIFWAPAGSGLGFEPGYEALVTRFVSQVAADSHMPSNVYGLSGQYRDAFGPAAYNSSYAGWVVDTAPLPPSGCQEPQTGPPWTTCVTDAQIEDQLEQVVSANRLPRTGFDVYFIVTPNGLGDCMDSSSTSCALGGSDNGYCAYHSQTLDGLLYAVIPYNAVPGHCQSDSPRPNNNTADPALSTISHEHNEVVTDPEADAWIDQQGEEDGDLCIQSFGPNLGGSGQGAWNEVIHGGHYYLQEEWSNENHACEPREKSDSVWFPAPGRGQASKPLRLSSRARDPHGSIMGYDWFFGDGRSSHGRTVQHVYRRPGVYRVVLRVTDSADNWGFYSRMVRVSRAPAGTRRR